MSRPSLLILFGVLIVLVPFSGLPMSFRHALSIIFGACVLGIGLSLRARDARLSSVPTDTRPPAAPPGVSPI